MPDDAHPTDAELARYLAGDLTPQERARVEGWIENDSANRDQVEALRGLWARSGDQPSDERVDEVWQSMSARLGLTVPSADRSNESLRLVRNTPPRIPRVAMSGGRRWVAISTVALAAAASVVVVVNARSSRPDSIVVPEPAYREYVTSNAQRADVRLNDGTRVVIAPASRLRVPEDYGTTTRSLILEGEAYFDVAHDETKPFTVRSANTTTRDIGTAFVVTDYANESAAYVLVADGEVAVLGRRDSTASTLQLLKPGDLARVTSQGTVSRTRVKNVNRRLAWVKGGLVFDDAQFGDAVRIISRWYDLDIALADRSLESLRLAATIGDEPADDVLRIVALALDLRYERQGRTVTFRSRVTKP